MKRIRRVALAAIASSVLVGGSAHAGVIFADNFDSDNASSALNFNALLNWTVDSGTIDYIRNGDYGIGCVGAGGCLDMDGSSSNAGRIVSKLAFSIDTETAYLLEAQVSGNQRSGSGDIVSFGLLDSVGAVALNAFSNEFAPSDPFTTIYVGFKGVLSSGTYRLFFEGTGGDNVGAILDNVLFSDVSTTTTVPEPGTLLLSGFGLAIAGVSRRRKHK